MADKEWLSAFKTALTQRYNWLSSSEVPKLRGALRAFYAAYSSLYTALVAKGLVAADPYKNESKVADLKMPETGPFTEANKNDQFYLRLANYDNQLDYIVNFYTLSVETLSQDKIKTLLAVIKFIDWLHPTPDSPSVNTQAMAGIITQGRRNPSDPAFARGFTDNLKKLEVSTKEITGLLKEFSDYNREAYKGEVREKITADMSSSDATVANIKKKFADVCKGQPFYNELVEELVKEDYSLEGPALQKKIIAKLAVEGSTRRVEDKPKQPPSLKPILIEGLNAIGSAGATLGEICVKIDINHKIHQNKRKSFGEKVKEIFSKIINKDPEPVVYECESLDANRNALVKEKIVFNQFYDELEKKSKILKAVSAEGPAVGKLESMQESQLLELLDRNIRDVQTYQRQLGGLDEFFKTEVDREDRAKIRGIQPEISTIKNALSKAISRKHEYTASQEEAEQFKKLGIGA
jgi:hypothetical protein